MRLHLQLIFTILSGLFFWFQPSSHLHAGFGMPMFGQDSLPMSSLVLVEAYDHEGHNISQGIGVILKKGFVALNYHYVAGAEDVVVYKPGQRDRYPTNGYLSVDEEQDLIIISVPALEGSPAVLGGMEFPAEGSSLNIAMLNEEEGIQAAPALVKGFKEIMDRKMPQLVSKDIDECTGGPIFHSGKLTGFVVAGYRDESRYFAYAVSANDLRRLLSRSFIIKSYNSVRDDHPIGAGRFQANLMESLSSVLWTTLPEAERMARKRKRMIIIDVSTKWTGWSNLMDKNTYSRKRIIRYLNENFYAVRLDAESNDTITFNNVAYVRNFGSTYHALAYSLLEGQMSFPSTVILDEDINEIFVIPGYMDANKMEVMLHFFSEKAYEKNIGFSQFEQSYWQREGSQDDQ
jgi:thioredoxin-related protein